MDKQWESYEEVARYLIEQYRDYFGLSRVEGKQDIQGEHTTWQVDCLGYTDNEEMVVIECKCWKSRVDQGTIGKLAHCIRTTKATGGIIVSPAPLQSGAVKEAKGAGITHVRLNPNDTPEHHLLRFLNTIVFQGTRDYLSVTPSVVSIEIITEPTQTSTS